MDESSTERQRISPLVPALVIAGAFFRPDLFKSLLVFFATLGVLVLIHEWGHFIAARAVGVRVYEFAFGFGPKLWTYMRRKGTEYTIRAFPLGGFVSLKGMEPDAPIEPDGLNGRRPAERALVYLAGPLMNVILGLVVFSLMGFAFGVPDDSKVLVGEVKRKTPATQMEVRERNGQPAPANYPRGLRVGDHVLQVNGQPVDSFHDVLSQVTPSIGREVTVRVQRGRDELLLVGTPAKGQHPREAFPTVVALPPGTSLDLRPGDQIESINGESVHTLLKPPAETVQERLAELEGQEVVLGVWRGPEAEGLEKVEGIAGPLEVEMRPGTHFVGQLGFGFTPGAGDRMPLGESVKTGVLRTVGYFTQLFAMFQKPKALAEDVGGPIHIFAVLGQVHQLPALHYAFILGQLSLSLAFFNLLPIVMLDGGHMMMLTLEVLRRRRLEPELQRRATTVGLAFILLLFVAIISKDLLRYLG